MTRLLLLTALLATFPLASARADQCAYIERPAAARALEQLQSGDRVVFFCEMCGDAEPAAPVVVYDLKVRETGYERTREVVINGEPIDLAYTFVEREPGVFVNLAKLARCPAVGVSERISVEPPVVPAVQESLQAPVVHTPETCATTFPAPHVVAPTPAEAPIEHAPRDSMPSWLAFLMGAGVVAPFWALIIVAFLQRRRWD